VQKFSSTFVLALPLLLASSILAQTLPAAPQDRPFIHPGILQTAEDLQRIKQNVKDGKEPWAAAWQAFASPRNRWISKSYTPRPLEVVGRGVGATGQDNISNDCTAAYYNAIAWTVTGDEAYAKKSVEIVNAWSYKCKLINGKDAVLCAGIYGYKLMAAAEILRATYPGWSQADIAQFKSLARDVFYPVIKDFATFANGNWDAAAQAAMISIAVFLDDRPMFDRATRYYMAGAGDGSVLHYIINNTGQLQETGRDQVHAQLGIGLLSCTAQIAWNQGIDLYGAYDHRLLKGFEYTAKFNLGEEVPFEPTSDRTGKYIHKQPSARGTPNLAIYEMVCNHYVNLLDMPAPYTARAAESHRPETMVIDQVGAGTLLFTLPPFSSAASPRAAPMAPGPIIAKASRAGTQLLWPASVHAVSYALKRAATATGPFEILAKDLHTPGFTDSTAAAGKLYFYTVSAANPAGTSPDSLPSGAAAGLPAPWQAQDIGAAEIPGSTFFDGTTFTLEAAGSDIGAASRDKTSSSDQFHFASLSLPGDGALTARYVPQTPSQFARFGVMMRTAAAPDAPFVALLITPQSTNDIEVPNWHVALLTRPTAGSPARTIATSPTLDTPVVTWGRLMAPLWLKLSRSGDTFTASYSPDGQSWTTLGSANLAAGSPLSIGLAGCSHIQGSTTVMFDNVAAPGWPARP
jgi:Alginate lyase/Protein of unknown function (DUF1349)